MSHNIDKIYYINLNKRTDRREQIEKELNEFGLKYERFEAIETHGFGIHGCGLSHLAVLKSAKENNYENALILEDDFTFLVSKDEFEQELTSFFNLNIHFDVLMLSYLLKKTEDTEYAFISKIKEVETASGYIVNKHYYDVLIELYEWAMPLLDQTKQHWIYCNDQVWKRLQGKDTWYSFTKRIGKQAPGYSDNAQQFFDYDV
jgi:glycosyl transferase family 25